MFRSDRPLSPRLFLLFLLFLTGMASCTQAGPTGVEQMVARIEVTPAGYDFSSVGQTTRITARAYDGSGNLIDGVGLKWSTNNASVAIVDSMGRVTSKGTGKAKIMAAAVCCTVSATAAMTVGDGQPNLAPGQALFSDGFETGDLSRAENGFSWGGSAWVHVTDLMSHSGTKSLQFRWNGNANSEQRFSHPPLKEYWAEYYIYFPDGTEPNGAGGKLNRYEHFYASGASNNNKFYAAWADQYSGKPFVVFQTWASDGESPDEHVNVGRSVGDTSPHTQYPSPSTNTPLVVGNGDRGRWIQVRLHLKVADVGKSNGVIQMWRDGSLVIDVRNQQLYDPDGEHDYFAHGYLLGWRNDVSNAGYSVDTSAFIDDFRMYSSNPGW